MSSKSFHIALQIKDGKLKRERAKHINEFINSCKDGVYDLVIKRRKVKPTLSQYGYLFAAIIDPLAEEQGFLLKENVKELLKNEIGIRERLAMVNKETGEIVSESVVTKSLSDYSKEELSSFIEKAIIYASHAGVIVEPPEEYYARIEAERKIL